MKDRTTDQRLPQLYVDDMLAVFAYFGVGDLVGVEGTEERTVQLSPRSTVACPMHLLELKPDACRSCRFLAGEVRGVK